ncbi:hypothetical protein [Comamonas jiangduensis]|uniref:hypothetical protein n=1 Tax=Comamonas jiangduensis TaxID=1194168 RepID=UPI003BF8345C
MAITLNKGTCTPSKNSVYMLSNGMYAKFQDGQWFKASADFFVAARCDELDLASAPAQRVQFRYSWMQLSDECLASWTEQIAKTHAEMQVLEQSVQARATSPHTSVTWRECELYELYELKERLPGCGDERAAAVARLNTKIALRKFVRQEQLLNTIFCVGKRGDVSDVEWHLDRSQALSAYTSKAIASLKGNCEPVVLCAISSTYADQQAIESLVKQEFAVHRYQTIACTDPLNLGDEAFCRTQAQNIVGTLARSVGAVVGEWCAGAAKEWLYTDMHIQGRKISVGASTGGVVSFDGDPFTAFPERKLINSYKNAVAALLHRLPQAQI